ncbi:RNA polymerase sigma factor [Nonomuraea rosea]|uniref:RNA polymerase sigma factor n=1 Tax=Nonomuraea rosea TaxID=638574 RepID=A0ABP6YXW6_9ACTN
MTEVGAGTLAEMLDERQHLLEIARWMFGSPVTADRIVQETYRRWYALGDAERAGITVPRAWLTRVAGGLCLELLAAPVAAPPSPSLRSPVGLPTADDAVCRPEPGIGSAQQWATSRQAMLARHDRVARRFAAACEAGDAAALKAVLAAKAMVVSDGGGKIRAAVRPTHGADAVARFVTTLLGRTGADMAVQPEMAVKTVVAVESVNGRTGLVLRREGQVVAAVSVSVAEGEVTAVWIVLNPDKLQHWHRP